MVRRYDGLRKKCLTTWTHIICHPVIIWLQFVFMATDSHLRPFATFCSHVIMIYDLFGEVGFALQLHDSLNNYVICLTTTIKIPLKLRLTRLVTGTSYNRNSGPNCHKSGTTNISKMWHLVHLSQWKRILYILYTCPFCFWQPGKMQIVLATALLFTVLNIYSRSTVQISVHFRHYFLLWYLYWSRML